MSHYVVYSKKLAYQLINDSFKLISTEINIKHPEFYVFIFEYSDELIKAIKRYSK